MQRPPCEFFLRMRFDKAWDRSCPFCQGQADPGNPFWCEGEVDGVHKSGYFYWATCEHGHNFMLAGRNVFGALTATTSSLTVRVDTACTAV